MHNMYMHMHLHMYMCLTLRPPPPPLGGLRPLPHPRLLLEVPEPAREVGVAPPLGPPRGRVAEAVAQTRTPTRLGLASSSVSQTVRWPPIAAQWTGVARVMCSCARGPSTAQPALRSTLRERRLPVMAAAWVGYYT